MLQPDAAHAVGQRDEEFVAIEMAAAEGEQRLLAQRLQRRQAFGRQRQQLGLVGDDIRA